MPARFAGIVLTASAPARDFRPYAGVSKAARQTAQMRWGAAVAWRMEPIAAGRRKPMPRLLNLPETAILSMN